MEKFKFGLFSVLVIALVSGILYWAVTSIQSGSDHKAKAKIEQLENENEKLKEEKEELESELAVLQEKVDNQQPEIPEPTPEETKPVIPVKKPTTTTVYKNQTLINELQKLVSDNVFMKLKSSGSRVGTVQKFLNIYNKTSNKIDNDYGVAMQTA